MLYEYEILLLTSTVVEELQYIDTSTVQYFYASSRAILPYSYCTYYLYGNGSTTVCCIRYACVLIHNIVVVQLVLILYVVQVLVGGVAYYRNSNYDETYVGNYRTEGSTVSTVPWYQVRINTVVADVSHQSNK